MSYLEEAAAELRKASTRLGETYPGGAVTGVDVAAERRRIAEAFMQLAELETKDAPERGLQPQEATKTGGALDLRDLDAARHPNIRENEGARTA